MKKTKFFNIKIISLIILILFILYYVLNLFFLEKQKTFIATSSSFEDTLNISGIVVRSEIIINTDRSDNIIYNMKNASKISKESVIARIYKNFEEVTSLKKIENIDQEIEILDSVSNAQGNISNHKKFLQNIYNEVNNLNVEIQKSNFDNISIIKNEVLKLLLRRLKFINKDFNLNNVITKLQNEKENLLKNIKNDYKEILAPKSGYFVNYTDGYEELINLQNYKDFSIEEYEKFINDKQTQNNYSKIGKIIDDYKWIYISVIEKNKLNRDINIGDQYNLNFDLNKNENILGKVVDIKNNNDKIAIFFECDTLNEDMVSFRIVNSEIIFKTYNGIKVDKNALRIINDKKGVYILENNKLLFKKVEIIFEDKDYIVCKVILNDDSYLKVYDEVLLN